jgi:hypothetical protein
VAITNVSVFRSTDGGITQADSAHGRIQNTAGDRIGFLNMLLLNGYNWQEVTPANLTNNNTGTTTLALTGHGFNIYQRLWMVGMDQIGYLNGTTYGDTLYPTAITSPNALTLPCVNSTASPATAAGSTTANGAIASTTTTSITVASASGFPASSPYVVKIDSEYMLVTAGFGTTTWTVVRGFAASTAATHLTGAAIAQKILIGVAPAGGFNHWTADYTATNKSTYRPPAGNRFFLDVDDTAGSGVYAARVRGYETMSAVGTGTGDFPTVATNTNPYFATNNNNTTPKLWAAIASDRMLIIWVDALNAVVNQSSQGGLIFTDLIEQTKSGDAYATFISAGAGGYAPNEYFMTQFGQLNFSTQMPRTYAQTGAAIKVSMYPKDRRSPNGYAGASGGLTFPHPPDGGLYMTQINVMESTAISRGVIPGLWAPCHQRPFQTFDIVQGTGDHAGRAWLMLDCYSGRQLAFEISNTIQGT